MDTNTATEIAYKNGYKKGVMDVLEEIDSLFLRFLDDHSYSSGELVYDISKLKRKYKDGKS